LLVRSYIEFPLGIYRVIALLIDAAIADANIMRRLEAVYATEKGLLEVVQVPPKQVVSDYAIISRYFTGAGAPEVESYVLYHAGENELLAVPVVVERLDAEPIPGAEKLAAVGVPQCERPHSIEPREAIRAPPIICS